MILRLLKVMLPPDAKLPKDCYEAKKIIKDLGLNYEKIHACPNDCMLFWKEHANDDFCKCCASRWVTNDAGSEPNVSNSSKKETTEAMQWHANGQTKDPKMRHPADAPIWKSFDSQYEDFVAEPHNVRLGLVCDGFNPYGNMSTSYSIWPVILIPYNLPPWMCMKQNNFILSLVIPGPRVPTKDIDVYLSPLVDELKELWEVGVETYDASSKENFQVRASLLWTIHDFLAYGAFLTKTADFVWMEYHSMGVKKEMGLAPHMLSGKEDEPVILASQASQVYYVKDVREKEWVVAVSTKARDVYDVGNGEGEGEEDGADTYYENEPYNVATEDIPADMNKNLIGRGMMQMELPLTYLFFYFYSQPTHFVGASPPHQLLGASQPPKSHSSSHPIWSHGYSQPHEAKDLNVQDDANDEEFVARIQETMAFLVHGEQTEYSSTVTLYFTSKSFMWRFTSIAYANASSRRNISRNSSHPQNEKDNRELDYCSDDDQFPECEVVLRHYKDDCWNIIQLKFVIPENNRVREGIKHKTLKSLGVKLRDWRWTLKNKYFDEAKTPAQVVAKVPPKVNREHYANLVSCWFSNEGKALSLKNMEDRDWTENKHTTGSKSFAQHAHEMEAKFGFAPSRAMLYKPTHTGADGTVISEIASANIVCVSLLKFGIDI
ncbi:hypothetical protein Vadar_012374 [Vaccinium darrowii]|uniref:Uncharacterized protein n=1 Tax=Vaccinium darrowii TaxID=229202 RepID=A0ACB7X039_9ERIC|nr:hypothetical protein Vadar_012374 [Vaccinium darrowii]